LRGGAQRMGCDRDRVAAAGVEVQRCSGPSAAIEEAAREGPFGCAERAYLCSASRHVLSGAALCSGGACRPNARDVADGCPEGGVRRAVAAVGPIRPVDPVDPVDPVGAVGTGLALLVPGDGELAGEAHPLAVAPNGLRLLAGAG